jgi:ribonuclease P protein component
MQTFRKDERLSGQKIIERLFSEGKSYSVFPFRIIWLKSTFECDFPARIMISVSKKRFKRAVDRNLIKRRIREAYRKNKPDIYAYLSHQQVQCAICLIYNAERILDYTEIEEKIKLLLLRFQSEYEKNIE